MNRLQVVVLGISVLGAVGIAQAQAPAFNIIETRQAGQDLLAGNFTGIIQGVRSKAPVKAFGNSAAAMARWMKQFPTTFPEGSDKGRTRALPTVWSDRAGFEQAAANFVTAADKLSELAKVGDTDAFEAQVKTVGEACDACHNKFRAK